MSKIINGEEFNSLVLGSNEVCLVDFYADWCGPCRMLVPVMDGVSKEHTVYKLNVDDEEEIARQFGVMSIPCVIAFKDGKEINRSVGLVSKSDILKLIEE